MTGVQTCALPISNGASEVSAAGLVAMPGERLSRAVGDLTEAELAAAEVFTLEEPVPAVSPDGGDAGDVVSASAQALLEAIADDQIVFEDDNFLDGHKSAWGMTLVNVGDVLGLLDGSSGQVAQRHESPPQQSLLVFAVKQQHLHQ